MIETNVTQADIDFQQDLFWKTTVEWVGRERLEQMIADYRSSAELRVKGECEGEIARLRKAIADIANQLSFLSNPVDLALAQYTRDVRQMAKKALEASHDQ